MRVAHVTDGYLPRVGGIETQVRELATRQQAAGHDVTVVTSVAAGGEPLRASDVVVLRPDERWLAHRDGSIRYARTPRGVSAVVDGAFDVVHVHASTFSPLAFLTAAATTRRRVPTAVTLHSLWARATPLFAAADRLTQWSRWPVAWSAVSDVCAAPLRAVLAGRAEVAVLPNSVDPADWSVRHVPAQGGALRLVSVLRLAPRKRPLQLLHVLRAARDRVPADVELRADIVGDGPERPALERYLRRHRMTGWVTLHGYLDRDRIRDLYARTDVFLAPATLESFGIAALEARAAGLPVVARRGTGIEGFITDDREGLLVASDDAMATAIERLATSRTLTSRLAAHNRAVPPSGTWDDVLARCDLLYRTAAAAVQQSPGVLLPVPAAVRAQSG